MQCLNNVKYYPLGEAELELTDTSLKIKNLTNSGIDGIMIDVNGAEDFVLDFKDFQIGIDNSLNVSHLGIDEWDRLKTLAQQSIYFNPVTNRVETSFNSRLSSKKGILLQGLEDDKIVFQGRYPNPEFDPCISWWTLIGAAVGWVANKIDYKYHTETSTSFDKGKNETVNLAGKVIKQHLWVEDTTTIKYQNEALFCYVLKGENLNYIEELGEFKCTYFYNEKYGFVKWIYHPPWGDEVLISLRSTNF